MSVVTSVSSTALPIMRAPPTQPAQDRTSLAVATRQEAPVALPEKRAAAVIAAIVARIIAREESASQTTTSRPPPPPAPPEGTPGHRPDRFFPLPLSIYLEAMNEAISVKEGANARVRV